jgi:hypothetical protein
MLASDVAADHSIRCAEYQSSSVMMKTTPVKLAPIPNVSTSVPAITAGP